MKKNNWISLFIFFIVALFLFQDSIFHSKIAFPGDLLISEYSPFKFESYLGYNPGSYPNKAQYFDVIRQMIPWKNFVIQSFTDLSIPFWNPYNFAGSPMLANNQSAPFYPLNILFFTLPFGMSWNIFLFLQIVGACFFMYLFAKSIKISQSASIFAGFAYGLGLFMSTFFEYGIVGHTILWLPLTLYAVEKFMQKKSISIIALFSCSVILSLLAGHLQIFFLSFIFILLYIFLRILFFKESKKLVWVYIVPFACVGIFSFLLWHTLEFVSYSARAPHTHKVLMNFLIQPSEFILFFSPDFFGNPVSRNYLLDGSYPGNAVYIGMFALFFSLYAVFIWKKNLYIKIFSLLLIFLLLVLVKNPVSFLLFKIPIGFITASSPSNGLFLISFVLAILSGFGIDSFLKNPISIKKFSVIISIFIFSALIGVVSHNSFVLKNLIYSIGLTITFMFILVMSMFMIKMKKYTVILFILILIADLSYFFIKFNPFSPKEFMYPPHEVVSYLRENAGINRVWGYGLASLNSNIETHYRIYSPDGYDPLYPRWYGEFLNLSKDSTLLDAFDETTRSNALLAPGFGEEDLAQNKARLRVMDTIGVKYILDRVENGTSEKTFPVDRFEKIYDKKGWRIFENKKAAPRIFFTNNIWYAKNTTDFSEFFLSDNFDPGKSIILDGKGKNISRNIVTELPENVTYLPNFVSFDINAPESGYVFLSDVFYPRWEVIQPKNTPILKADHAFRAIPIEKGTHSIQLKYNGGLRSGNNADLLSYAISVISFGLLLLYGFIIYKKK